MVFIDLSTMSLPAGCRDGEVLKVHQVNWSSYELGGLCPNKVRQQSAGDALSENLCQTSEQLSHNARNTTINQ
jgi:hypothetical protein